MLITCLYEAEKGSGTVASIEIQFEHIPRRGDLINLGKRGLFKAGAALFLVADGPDGKLLESNMILNLDHYDGPRAVMP